MPTPRDAAAAAALACALLFTLTCSAPQAPPKASAPAPCDRGEIAIATDLPTSGADSAVGLPALNGAAFAVAQHACAGGYRVTLKNFDDASDGRHDPKKGAENLQTIAAAEDVLGVVGPLNSNVAVAEIPIANRASLALVSPAASVGCLTLDLEYCRSADGFSPASLRPAGPNNFFRVTPPYPVQGGAMADYAYDTLRVRRAAAISDGNPSFGKAVKDAFVAEFTKRGGTVVANQDFSNLQQGPDLSGLLKAASQAGAQAVYSGAASDSGGCLARAQSKGILAASTYYFGPVDIADEACLRTAGEMAGDSMYATVGGGDALHNPRAESTVTAFRRAHPRSEQLGAYTFATYDCAAVLIDAIGRAVEANGGRRPTRQQVLQAVAGTTAYPGLTGVVAFNAQGDPVLPVVQVLQSKQGTWTFAGQLNVMS